MERDQRESLKGDSAARVVVSVIHYLPLHWLLWKLLSVASASVAGCPSAGDTFQAMLHHKQFTHSHFPPNVTIQKHLQKIPMKFPPIPLHIQRC